MNRFSLMAAISIVMAAVSAVAAPSSTTTTVPAFPGTLASARYVYVASYDGDQFDPTLLPKIGRRSDQYRTPFRIGAN